MAGPSNAASKSVPAPSESPRGQRRKHRLLQCRDLRFRLVKRHATGRRSKRVDVDDNARTLGLRPDDAKRRTAASKCVTTEAAVTDQDVLGWIGADQAARPQARW